MRIVILSLILFSSQFVLAQEKTCPSAQSERLGTWLAAPPNPVPPDQQKPVATRAQLDQVCVPGGQRAYLVARGVLPPKVEEGEIATADESLYVATSGGEKPVVLRISEQGRVTAAYVVTEQNNLAQEVTAAFKDLKLAPATFKGAPVPVVFKLKMDFKERPE